MLGIGPSSFSRRIYRVKIHRVKGGEKMKKLVTVLGAVGLMFLLAQPTWAKCAPLIKEGRELLPNAKLAKANEDKAKALLDEAQKALDAKDHKTGVEKANEALAIIKKK
jgi:hypothetical protein